MFERIGEITPPCGEPSVAWRSSPSSRTPAFSHLSIILRITPSVTRLSRKARRCECGVNDFRVAAEQLRIHLGHRLLGIAPGTVGVLFGWKVGLPSR